MTTHSNPWPAGTPCWVDLMASDLGRTQAFYRDVLGWDYTESQPEYGGYCNAQVGGEMVAGLSPTMEGMESAPHVWSVYLATNDIAARAAQAVEAGATQVYEPMEVGPFGSMAMLTDPTGAAFGLWQADEHVGFTRVEEPGAVAWCDLMTADPAAARDFYGRLFGYAYQDIGDESMPYALFTVPGGDRPAGGIGGPDPNAGDTQPGWGVAFQVEDVDAAAERVRTAGGTVSSEPSDFEYGRMAVATGPDGEVFVLMTPSEEM
ncbi:VOC family protein [Kocuria sp. LUK]|uniref:VOC family protein n=1 Tax=Kocuria sp. LUK TaxID=2897828 RepID=UPI001E3FEAB0|nr:VOC family protein [Kocuria sp. LUK]MCD1146154.1 VOC family protein [Kocuria sp. LUK]